MPIKLPDWLPALTGRDERLRAAHGLTPKVDGWYKSIDGKACYIAKPMTVADVVAILPERVEAIRARRQGKPTPVTVQIAGMALRQLVEMFLASMFSRVQTGIPKTMERRTYDDYVDVLTRFLVEVGPDVPAAKVGPAHFTAYARTFAGKAASTRRREIQYIDRLFNWAGPGTKSMNLIPFVMRGPDWVKPSDHEISTHAADSDKAYDTATVRAIFDKVKGNPVLNAWAHLGLNCAFNAMDIAELPDAAVDFTSAIIRFPRGKTGVGRLCPLVPDTVDALKTYLAMRAKLTSVRDEAKDLFFRTRRGYGYYRDYVDPNAPDDMGCDYNRVTKYWSQNVRMPFTGLRSTFATLADDWADQRAIDVVMGHKVGHTGRHVRTTHYAKRFDPSRARKLVEHVWLRAFATDAPQRP